MPEIKVTHIFVDPETGKESDQPFPAHIERIAAALGIMMEDEECEQRRATSPSGLLRNQTTGPQID